MIKWAGDWSGIKWVTKSPKDIAPYSMKNDDYFSQMFNIAFPISLVPKNDFVCYNWQVLTE